MRNTHYVYGGRKAEKRTPSSSSRNVSKETAKVTLDGAEPRKVLADHWLKSAQSASDSSFRPVSLERALQRFALRVLPIPEVGLPLPRGRRPRERDLSAAAPPLRPARRAPGSSVRSRIPSRLDPSTKRTWKREEVGAIEREAEACARSSPTGRWRIPRSGGRMSGPSRRTAPSRRRSKFILTQR